MKTDVKALENVKKYLLQRAEHELDKIKENIGCGGGGVHELGVVEGLRYAITIVDIELGDAEGNKKNENN